MIYVKFIAGGVSLKVSQNKGQNDIDPKAYECLNPVLKQLVDKLLTL